MSDSLEPRPDSDPPSSTSSTGLEDNLGGTLCYLLGFVSAIAFLILERENRSIRFHAYQSLATFGGLFVLSVAVGVIPFFGWIVGLLLTPISVILWLVLMIKTLQGDPVELPVIGDWAREQSQR